MFSPGGHAGARARWMPNMQSRGKRVYLLPAALLLWAGSLATPGLAQVRIDAEAVTGGRFGVGRIKAVLPEQMLPEPLGAEGLRLNEKNCRALYPAVHAPEVGAVVKEILAEQSPLFRRQPLLGQIGGLVGSLLDQPPTVTIYFLFRGDAPLELTLEGRSAHAIAVTPRSDPAAHRRFLEAWWRQYTAPPGLLETKPDYPPLVENYLTATLARRLSLKLPEEKQTQPWRQELEQELGLMLGTESVRVAM